MGQTLITGIIVTTVAGLLTGICPWPLKFIRQFKYEHWGFFSMLTGFVLAPWIITLSFCPNAITAIQTVGWVTLVKSNLFSLSWGIANILYLLCLVRIGVSLTYGIMTGIAVSVGVVIPMIFKGSGQFENAPDLFSSSGIVVLAGVAIMVIGVVGISVAGSLREKHFSNSGKKDSKRFRIGLVMVILSGFLSAGMSFSFVYGQGPIMEAMKVHGAGDVAANIAVWAVAISAGALINIIYPLILMMRNRNWNVILKHPIEIVWSFAFGLTLFAGFAMLGKGMLLLGVLGASVGFGIQQVMQVLGGQSVGLLKGEWKGISGRAPKLMVVAISILIVAAIVMAYGISI